MELNGKKCIFIQMKNKQHKIDISFNVRSVQWTKCNNKHATTILLFNFCFHSNPTVIIAPFSPIYRFGWYIFARFFFSSVALAKKMLETRKPFNTQPKQPMKETETEMWEKRVSNTPTCVCVCIEGNLKCSLKNTVFIFQFAMRFHSISRRPNRVESFKGNM